MGKYGGKGTKGKGEVEDELASVKRETETGEMRSPSREVSMILLKSKDDKSIEVQTHIESKQSDEALGEPKTQWMDVWKVEIDNLSSDPDPGTAQPEVDLREDTTLFTRMTKPFASCRVNAVLESITIGDDLSPDQRTIVESLLKEYADCFTLSMGEVHIVPGAIHKINILEGKTFNTKVHQRPLTPPQREYLNGVIDKMLKAGVVVPIPVSKVKCVSPTTLVQKVHKGGGLTLEELQHRLNDQCINAGLPARFDLPLRPPDRQIPEVNHKE